MKGLSTSGGKKVNYKNLLWSILCMDPKLLPSVILTKISICSNMARHM